MIPDLCVDGTGRELDEKAKKVLGDQGRALFDWKTLAPGKAYSETASTEFAAVANKRQVEVTRQYRTTAKHLDAKLGTPPDEIGPVETELNTYNSGAVVGLVAGAFGDHGQVDFPSASATQPRTSGTPRMGQAPSRSHP